MFDESPSEAWISRYGTKSPDLPDLGKFLNHRSVRKFKTDPISEEVMAGLVAAAQSAATSSNLQLFSLISVQNPERRELIAEISSNQDQVRKAPWFFVFLADHHRLRTAARRVGESAEALEFTEFFTMAVIDAALAAERMVCAAESLGISICYIGALRNDPEAVKEVLDLPAGTFALFGLCLGYPAEPVTANIKPRLPQESVWYRETYLHEPDVESYDERMRAFYADQKMRGEVTWSMRSGRRADLQHLEGREGQLEWLQANGMLRR